jgi:hypothetical protein
MDMAVFTRERYNLGNMASSPFLSFSELSPAVIRHALAYHGHVQEGLPSGRCG